jgi:hypothetical protein
VAFFALLDYDELHNLRVRSEIFDQISCFHNFPFQVVTSVRRICFFRAGMNVLLPPKAEIPLRTHHDCARYSKEAARLQKSLDRVRICGVEQAV